jgi:glycosyltransferase involved in cell wall biosynthesis
VIVARTNTYIHVPNLLKLLATADESVHLIGAHPTKINNMNVIDFDAGYVFRTALLRGFVPSTEPFDISLLTYGCRNNIPVRLQGGFHKINFECSHPHTCDECIKSFRENNTVFTFGNMSERDMERYHAIVEKELQGKAVQVALAFMIKDEERKVQYTLDFYANSTYFPEIYILDTGSTDKTLEKVEEWKQSHPSTNVIVYEEPFRDFSYNRNYLLDRIYASSTCEYILSIDCNDELRNQDLFIKYLQTFVRYPVFYITQMWKAGVNADPITFKTMRLLKNNGAYRWKYRVHEVLVPINDPPSSFQVSLPEEIVLYQFREEEYEKEKAARFKRDLAFFLEDYNKNPTDTRIVYYTAQTYFFNQDYVNCIDFSKKRIALANPNVKDEETYQSIFRIAKCHILLNHDAQTIKKWLWRSWDYLKDIEPLLYIAQMYEKEDDTATALHLYLLACDTSIPNVMLPIRKDLYSYERYLKTAEAYYKRKEYTKTYEYYSKILEHEKSSRKEAIQDFLNMYYPTYISKKPILVVYGGFFYDKIWDGEMFYEKKLSLGGSESMVVKLAHALSDVYNVYVFCNTDAAKSYKNVKYVPVSKYDEFLNINKVKHLILSRDSSKVHANAENTHLWLHDLTHANPTLHDSYSSVIVLSKFHKEYYTEFLKKLGKSSLIPKLRIIPNIVDGPSSLPKKSTTMRFIYSSCPTRGLERVVNDFATVKREFPDAELYIYSDFDNSYVKSKLNVPSLLEKINSTPGIHNVGRLPEDLFLEECKKANVWYYPTEWKETFCITAVQMIANGVLPIYTPVGSLVDVLEGGGIVMNESFDLISALKRKRTLLLEKGFEISKKYATERVKKLWLQLLK